MNIYDWADNIINTPPRFETGLTLLLAVRPYIVSPGVWQCFESRSSTIRQFQKTSIQIFKAALNHEISPDILRWLLNETPEPLGMTYHKRLEDRHFTSPVFFRTDEVRPGNIIEINSPAALWGELQLMYEYSIQMGHTIDRASPAELFANQLTNFLSHKPIIHQYTDKATSPGSTRFFIERTRPFIKYWGYDYGVRMADCNFIRHHTFADLWTDDNLNLLLDKMGKGVTFDYPPHVLFDQKATLALPFWSMTRDYFTDEIRALFPYTTPLLPGGIELKDGKTISIDEFSQWSRSRRSYYLKLAGFNTQLNWGGKAVYRLSNLSGEACLDFLQKRLDEYQQGRIWLLQKEESQDDEITFTTRDGIVHNQNLRTKFGGFYGPEGLIGVLAMHRGHYKVSGSESTILSHVLASDEDKFSS
jgi:hypothetical protein